MIKRILGTAAVLLTLVSLGACGQIGDAHRLSSGPSSSPTSSIPGGPGALGASPTANVTVSPADTCVTVRQLSAVEKQVNDISARFGELEQSEDVVADLGELVSDFQAAQTDLAAIPTVVEDRDITDARRLLGEVIAGFIAGLQELSAGYQSNDQNTLVNAALELDEANTTFETEYKPAIQTKASCL
jgi:hypothetical protein